MPLLFDDARLSTRSPGRSPRGLWLSVGVHAAVLAVIVLTMGTPGAPPAPRARPTRVFLPAMLPAAPIVTPRVPVPPPAPPPARELAKAEVPKPPPPPAPIVTKPVEPLPQPLAPPPVPVVERPIEKVEVARPVETGLFDRTSSARTNQAESAVTTGGFGSATAAQRSANAPGGVVTGGFNSGARAPRPAAQGEVQTAGFDQRPAAPAQAPAAVAKSAGRPVEIVFKPTPEYTDEARSARIEGTVSLELEFTAAGDVRVLRVVRGLGHGLDEAAQRAALRIRFKPAQSDAGPVDSRATVHITFRLS
jgi:TonB family protein